MRNIKDEIQWRAEELAQERYQQDFYDLRTVEMAEVYEQALDEVTGGD